MSFVGKLIFFIVLMINVAACNKNATDKDTSEFVGELFSMIGCPGVQPMFTTLEICAESYDISEIITLNMK